MLILNPNRDEARSGFTLIELLIVVLIIAILAAIAVPNFLEFQVRAKVARVWSDTRSLAVALEAYTVDWSRPPISPEQWEYNHGVTNMNSLKSMYPLTTPVAYISSIPLDAFSEKGRINSSGDLVNSQNAKTYRFRSYAPDDLNDSGQPSNGSKRMRARGYYWILWNFGPSRQHLGADTGLSVFARAVCIGNDPPLIYDPTNGSVSWGMMIRTPRGPFDGHQYRERD